MMAGLIKSLEDRGAMAGWMKLLALLVLLAAGSAQATVTLYGINNNAAGIQQISPTTSVATTVYSGAPFPLGTRSAAMAQCSSGLLYFVEGGNNATFYRFNPATPNVAPVAVGTTGQNVDFIRLACQPGTNTVYGMPSSPNTLYTFNVNTGAAAGTALTQPLTTPPAAGSGDIAFDAFGTLYFVGEATAGDATTVRLWTINLISNTIVNVGAITGLPNVVNGIAFDGAGNLLLSPSTQTQLYTVPTVGGAASPVGVSGAMPAVFDLAAKDVPNPDLSITKTDGRTFVSAGDTETYTIVVTNSSAYAVTGTVTDTVPASISGVTWTCSASGGSSCAAASGSGNAINTTATLAVGGTATYVVTGTLSAAATGTLSNTASVTLPFAFLTDATPANNGATDTTTITQNPTIAKAFAPATIAPNVVSVLTFTLTNPNATSLTGINFTDAYPAGLVNASPLTLGGTCAGVTTTAAAGGNSFNVTGGTIPGGAPGSCTITVQVTSGAFGTYNNTSSGVAAAQTTIAGPASNTAALTVANASPPTIAKSFAPATIQTNGTSVLTLTVTNPNASTTLTGVGVTDTYPALLLNRAAAPAANAAISCTAGSSATLTGGANAGSTVGLTAGSILAGGSCTVTVNVTSAALGTYNNTTGNVTSTNGGTGATAAASLTVQAGQVPPVISKAFSVSSTGVGMVATLIFTINNPNNSTLFNVAFADTYPAGLVNAATPNVVNTCAFSGNSGASVTGGAAGGNTIGLSGATGGGGSPNDIPANTTCTLSVDVTSAAAGTYNNTSGAVTGRDANGGGAATLTGNTASATIVFAPPTIAKSFSPTTIASGGTSTLTITLTNPTAVAFTGATFNDVFPTSPGAMTVASPLTTSNTCSGSLLDSGGGALAAADVGIRLTGGTIPASGSCTITVNVTAAVAGTYNNTIAAGALTTSGGSNAAAASASLTVALPSLTVAKTVLLVSDPTNGATNPKNIPGAVVLYSIQVTNSGAGTADNNTTVIVDPIPANTTLFVGDLGGAGSGPVAFVNGVPSSGLTYTFTSLASITDDVSFSNSGCGGPFTYTPVPVAGFDVNVTCIRINPKGVFAAASGGNNPSFQARFQVRVN